MLFYCQLVYRGGKLLWYLCLSESLLIDVEAHLASPAALDLYLLG